MGPSGSCTVWQVTPVYSLAANGGMMETQTTYIYLEHRPDKRTLEEHRQGGDIGPLGFSDPAVPRPSPRKPMRLQPTPS
jgi:hypothetical protein